MAQAHNLSTGSEYPVKAGPFKGRMATIVSNIPVPDGEENQRKILVKVDDEEVYLLPRLIDDGTVTPSEAAARAEAPVVKPASPAGETTHPLMQVDEYMPLTDAMDPRLDAYRPDPKIVKEYVSRKLPGGKKDVDMLLKYWRRKQNVLLVGDTQSGKTMVTQVIAVLAAEEMGLPKPFPVFTLSGSNGVTDYDLFGQPSAFTDPETGQEHLVWLPGVVDLAVRTGSFLNLDETNMFEDRTVSALNSVCDDRRSFVNRQKAVKVPGDGYMPEIVKAHENLWVIGSYNDGYRGAGAMQEAFANRFRHIPWDYDEATEKKLITSDVVRVTIGGALRTARRAGQINTPVGVRALIQLQESAYEDGVEYALWEFLGMFPGRDRDKVEVILRDRSAEPLLTEEVEAFEKAKAEAEEAKLREEQGLPPKEEAEVPNEAEDGFPSQLSADELAERLRKMAGDIDS